MKILYSFLKNNFLKNLAVDPKTLRDDLTKIGHFVSSLETQNSDAIFDLEIRQNRADCLGYFGLATDLATLYNQPIYTPPVPSIPPIQTTPALPIQVTSKNQVKRIMAIKLTGIKNKTSPAWLTGFLKIHDINPVNLIVDLTNYSMLYWGIPNHAFDQEKSTDFLIWELNHQHSSFVTLFGTSLKLRPNILMVNNKNKALSLSFLGGQESAVTLSTTQIILEMAVYDHLQVRLDSQFLKVQTEAGIRLNKYLDPNLIPSAFYHLVSLITKYSGAKIDSQLFDYYPQKISAPSISFDPSKPEKFAGIPITPATSHAILKRLGCQINNNLVVPPTHRPDITFEEDLIEEVIRFVGYDTIPKNEPISNLPLPSITPPILHHIEKLRDQLVTLGYDEVRSWPLTSAPVDQATVISTQNNINSHFPYLRQTITQSLRRQLAQYLSLKLPQPQFFEIGKTYRRQNHLYQENYSLGIYHHFASQLLLDLKSLNLTAKVEGNFAEIIIDNLDRPTNYQPQSNLSVPRELTSQIITLDANVTFDSPQDPEKLIKSYQDKIDQNMLWHLAIIDIFKNKYTFRASYFNCSDKKAKKVHLHVFGLENIPLTPNKTSP